MCRAGGMSGTQRQQTDAGQQRGTTVDIGAVAREESHGEKCVEERQMMGDSGRQRETAPESGGRRRATQGTPGSDFLRAPTSGRVGGTPASPLRSRFFLGPRYNQMITILIAG
jgi:hypothetical protein